MGVARDAVPGSAEEDMVSEALAVDKVSDTDHGPDLDNKVARTLVVRS